mmetsp:Transcript_12631/g.27937  ORF Transcript_12631/g.27937 Transcript_12631/m.27937 type:complete len:224 (-) Transcript_12631:81-752(-)
MVVLTFIDFPFGPVSSVDIFRLPSFPFCTVVVFLVPSVSESLSASSSSALSASSSSPLPFWAFRGPSASSSASSAFSVPSALASAFAFALALASTVAFTSSSSEASPPSSLSDSYIPDWSSSRITSASAASGSSSSASACSAASSLVEGRCRFLGGPSVSWSFFASPSPPPGSSASMASSPPRRFSATPATAFLPRLAIFATSSFSFLANCFLKTVSSTSGFR